MINYISHGGAGNAHEQSLPVHCCRHGCPVHLESLLGSALLCFPGVARLIPGSILFVLFCTFVHIHIVCAWNSSRGKAGEFFAFQCWKPCLFSPAPHPCVFILFYFFSLCILFCHLGPFLETYLFYPEAVLQENYHQKR